MSSYTRKLQQRMDGDDEPDRDDIDRDIALRHARARMNVRIVADRLTTGEDIGEVLRSVYNGQHIETRFAADIRRAIT